MRARFSVGGFEVRPRRNLVDGPEGSIHLEPRVMACLELLARRAGRVVLKEEFFERVWPGHHVVDDALVQCIAAIRHALGDTPEKHGVVETIPKRGYRLVAEVSGLEDLPDAPGARLVRPTLDGLLASCSDHIYVFDREERYLFVSAAGAAALGLEPEQLIHKTWRELGMPAEIMEPFHGEVASVFSGCEAVRRSVTYPTIYGNRRYEYILNPVRESGQIVAVVAIVREVE